MKERKRVYHARRQQEEVGNPVVNTEILIKSAVGEQEVYGPIKIVNTPP